LREGTDVRVGGVRWLLAGDSRPSRVSPPERMSGPYPCTEPNAQREDVQIPRLAALARDD